MMTLRLLSNSGRTRPSVDVDVAHDVDAAHAAACYVRYNATAALAILHSHGRKCVILVASESIWSQVSEHGARKCK